MCRLDFIFFYLRSQNHCQITDSCDETIIKFARDIILVAVNHVPHLESLVAAAGALSSID